MKASAISIGLTTNYDLLRVVPTGTPRETTVSRQGIAATVGSDQFVQELDVTNCQLQSVYFRQSLLVGQSRYMSSEAFESVVYILHTSPLPHVGGLSLLHRLPWTLPRSTIAPVALTPSGNDHLSLSRMGVLWADIDSVFIRTLLGTSKTLQINFFLNLD